MEKKEDLNSYLSSQEVRKAIEQATVIDNRHFLTVEDMRRLLASLGADYNTVCRYLPDKATVRDGFFVRWICIEACLGTLEKVNRLRGQETGKKLWGRIPYRNIQHVNGRVSTSDYER